MWHIYRMGGRKKGWKFAQGKIIPSKVQVFEGNFVNAFVILLLRCNINLRYCIM